MIIMNRKFQTKDGQHWYKFELKEDKIYYDLWCNLFYHGSFLLHYPLFVTGILEKIDHYPVTKIIKFNHRFGDYTWLNKVSYCEQRVDFKGHKSLLKVIFKIDDAFIKKNKPKLVFYNEIKE